MNREKYNKKLSQHFEKSKGLTIASSSEAIPEDREVEEWLMKDEINEIENTNAENTNAKHLIEDINFFCDKPGDCASRERYGNNCRCVRETFSSPDDFKHWTKTYSKLFEIELKEFIRRYKL